MTCPGHVEVTSLKNKTKNKKEWLAAGAAERRRGALRLSSSACSGVLTRACGAAGRLPTARLVPMVGVGSAPGWGWCCGCAAPPAQHPLCALAPFGVCVSYKTSLHLSPCACAHTRPHTHARARAHTARGLVQVCGAFVMGLAPRAGTG